MKLIQLSLIGLILIGCSTDKKKELPQENLKVQGQSVNEWTRENLKGQVKSVTSTSYSVVEKFGVAEKGSLTYKHIKKYDGKGNWLPDQTISYKYDDIGNLIEVDTYYNTDGSLSGKEFFKYDDKGNRTEGKSYKSDGSLSSKSTTKYDVNGNRLEDNYYDAGGNLLNKTIYKYDDSENLVEMKNDGLLSGKCIYKSYQYDKKGNWIRRMEFKEEAKQPNKINEQEIEYY